MNRHQHKHGFIAFGLIQTLLLPTVIFAQSALMQNYQYDKQNDAVSFEVEHINLHQLVNRLSEKQDIKMQIYNIPDRVISGTFSGRTDQIIKDLLQTESLVLYYQRTESNTNRLSGVETLEQGTESSAFLNQKKQTRTYYDDPEKMKKKAKKQVRREYRHSMGLGRINKPADEPVILNEHGQLAK